MEIPYLLILFALIIASLFKHLTLQNTAIKNEAGIIGANIFIAFWMLVTWIIASVIFEWHKIVLQDLKEINQFLPFLISFLKGFFVMIIISAKQWIAKGRKFNAYALVALVALGPLAFVNALIGEVLTSLQFFSAISLCIFGFIFIFYGEMKSVSTKGKLIFLLITIMGVCPAMVDNYVKLEGMSWQTSWLMSNLGLLIAAIVVSLKKEGLNHIKQHFVLATTNKNSLITATAWVLSEFVILFVMFTQLPVTATEASRNLYIPILMIVSTLYFNKELSKKDKSRKVKESAFWGTIAFILALPLML
jgi:hypothetical protein